MKPETQNTAKPTMIPFFMGLRVRVEGRGPLERSERVEKEGEEEEEEEEGEERRAITFEGLANLLTLAAAFAVRCTSAVNLIMFYYSIE